MDKCKELIIEQQIKSYFIKVIDFDNKVKMLDYSTNEVGVKNVCNLIQFFLSNFKVNGFKKMLPIVRNLNKNLETPAEVFLADDVRKISMRIYSPEFKFINQIVLNNYISNRFAFFREVNANEIKINAEYGTSKYELVDNVVNLTISTDLNLNVCNFEKEFFREFLEYRCGGKKVVMEFVSGKKEKDNLCIATCGELKIIFPRGYTYSALTGIIDDHNKKINETRKRR